MRRLNAVLCATLLTCGFGCGSEDDDRAEDARVVDVFLDESDIDVGEGTVARIDFRFDSSAVFDDDDNVVLVVRLPPGLRYREGTAELVEVFGDDKIGARELECSGSGESYLEFDMDEFDLDDVADVEGEADARLKLTVDAIRPFSIDAIGAAANNNSIPYSCGDRFFPDVEAGVSASL